MDVLDFIHDMFSRDYSVATVLDLVTEHYDLSEEQARGKIDEYFDIIEDYRN